MAGGRAPLARVMSAGEAIFARIRAGLGRGPLSAEEVERLEARVAAHAPNLIPARANGPETGRLALFERLAEDVGTTFAHVTSYNDVPAALLAYLTEHDLPTRLRMSPDPALDRIPWHDESALEIGRGRAESDDLVSVTPCFAAVAETGTLVLVSSADRPATLNFMPDTHVVVLAASDVLGSYEDAFAKLRRAQPGSAFMPRTVNFVTGPSRTADIELTIVRGAHGPRHLHVIVVRVEPAKSSDGSSATR
ncbi:MAG: LUD domain-containing protein [Candidatus Velthaea sp.]|jgi:L-lactate dehydrogenase complex protein LldG